MSDDPNPDDDPFANLDAPDDVDPFEDLEGPDDDSENPDEGDAGSDDQGADATASEQNHAQSEQRDEAVEDPYTPPGGDAADVPFGADAVAGDAAGSTDSDDPFASFSGTAGRTGSADDDPFGAFESVDIEGVDPDSVWNELSTAEQEGMPEFDEKVYYEVSKHRFCENCEHFSDPPEVACNYDGAAIVEFLDMETVRLVNCPIVAEQRALEEGVNDIGSE